MFSRHRLAEVAALFADASRASILISLWDGRARAAGELAALAGIRPATASGHLARLVAAGLLVVEVRGRHRYYRLAGPEVAQALESLARVLPPARTVAPSAGRLALARARMCYDHLAGRLGVGITDALLKRGCLRLAAGSLALTPAGRGWCKRFGVDVAAIEEARRPLVRTCLDWTERREHLAGALGAALANEMLEQDWLRRAREGRALLITTAGRRAVQRIFGLST